MFKGWKRRVAAVMMVLGLALGAAVVGEQHSPKPASAYGLGNGNPLVYTCITAFGQVAWEITFPVWGPDHQIVKSWPSPGTYPSASSMLNQGYPTSPSGGVLGWVNTAFPVTKQPYWVSLQDPNGTYNSTAYPIFTNTSIGGCFYRNVSLVLSDNLGF